MLIILFFIIYIALICAVIVTTDNITEPEKFEPPF